eukprot:TRINITY_DN11352_c0_g1_i1.p2 TRINITY_DN11352_c0_g1~~TRINITY_DN11352_c0_g1_i1.p2  ORF type:complete len:114 (-),score=19.81 TRINITY_DN11352_c0_g1_i1:16-357(-)
MSSRWDQLPKEIQQEILVLKYREEEEKKLYDHPDNEIELIWLATKDNRITKQKRTFSSFSEAKSFFRELTRKPVERERPRTAKVLIWDKERTFPWRVIKFAHLLDRPHSSLSK